MHFTVAPNKAKPAKREPMQVTIAQQSRDLGQRQEYRRRLTLTHPPAHIYAIGDVHGCLDLQQKMEKLILADSAAMPGFKLILYLGDLVDRGADCKGVIDHCLSPLPDGYERLSLCGNHDQMFQDFLQAPSLSAEWLGFGGRETLMSYGVDVDQLAAGSMPDDAFAALIGDAVPASHLHFLHQLPVAVTTPDVHFVHAGMRIGVPIQEQDATDLMWIRAEFLVDTPASDRLVVHGHTPASSPRLGPGRIGIDTKAVGGGPLTALHLHGGSHRFLSVVSEA